jgi:hypothetical protein
MGWFRGDESASSQKAYGGQPKGGLAESLERHQAAAQQAAEARADVADSQGTNGNGTWGPV